MWGSYGAAERPQPLYWGPSSQVHEGDGFFILYIVLEGPRVSFLGDLSSGGLKSTIEDMWVEEVRVLTRNFHEFTVSCSSKVSKVASLALAQLGSSLHHSKVD